MCLIQSENGENIFSMNVRGYRGNRVFSSLNKRVRARRCDLRGDPSPTRIWFARIVAFAAWTALTWTMLFHSYFQVDHVSIQGTQRIALDDIHIAVEGMLNTKGVFFLPGSSYMLIDVHDIADILKDRFPLSSVTVEKIFPGKLRVTVVERLSSIVYDNQRMYAFVSEEGTVTDLLRNVGDDEWQYDVSITTSTAEDGTVFTHEERKKVKHVPDVRYVQTEVGEYPFVVSKTGKELSINDTVLSRDTIRSAIQWYQLLQSHGMLMRYILVGSNAEGTVFTSAGHVIDISFHAPDVDRQWQGYQFLSSEHPEATQFDVRFDGRLFWQ